MLLVGCLGASVAAQAPDKLRSQDTLIVTVVDQPALTKKYTVESDGRITFPLLEPVTRFVFLTGVVGAFQVFTYVYVLTEGGPLHHTDTLAYRAYQVGWERLEFGYAAAITVCLCLVLLVVTRAQVKQLARDVGRA